MPGAPITIGVNFLDQSQNFSFPRCAFEDHGGFFKDMDGTFQNKDHDHDQDQGNFFLSTTSFTFINQ